MANNIVGGSYTTRSEIYKALAASRTSRAIKKQAQYDEKDKQLAEQGKKIKKRKFDVGSASNFPIYDSMGQFSSGFAYTTGISDLIQKTSRKQNLVYLYKIDDKWYIGQAANELQRFTTHIFQDASDAPVDKLLRSKITSNLKNIDSFEYYTYEVNVDFSLCNQLNEHNKNNDTSPLEIGVITPNALATLLCLWEKNYKTNKKNKYIPSVKAVLDKVELLMQLKQYISLGEEQKDTGLVSKLSQNSSQIFMKDKTIEDLKNEVTNLAHKTNTINDSIPMNIINAHVTAKTYTDGRVRNQKVEYKNYMKIAYDKAVEAAATNIPQIINGKKATLLTVSELTFTIQATANQVEQILRDFIKQQNTFFKKRDSQMVPRLLSQAIGLRALFLAHNAIMTELNSTIDQDQTTAGGPDGRSGWVEGLKFRQYSFLANVNPDLKSIDDFIINNIDDFKADVLFDTIMAPYAQDPSMVGHSEYNSIMQIQSPKTVRYIGKLFTNIK